MKTTLDKNDCANEPDAIAIEYSEEIMCGGWNPAVDMVCEQLLQVPTEEELAKAVELTKLNSASEVSTAISEMFLSKVYASQR